MTRKLVVTVLAVSLSVLGCGSDDGDTKDSSVDAVKLTDTAPKLDTVPKLDTTKSDLVSADRVEVKAEVSSEVNPDVPLIPDGGTKDTGVADVPLNPDIPVQQDTGTVTGSDAGDGGSVD